MSLASFNRLTLQQKSDAVWEWGFFLCNFQNPEGNKALFLLEDFFAELSLAPNGATLGIRALSPEEISADIRSMLRLHHPAFFHAVFQEAGSRLTQRNA